MFRSLILVFVSLLSACAQISEFKRPDAPVPIAWPQTQSPGEKQTITARWSDFFVDPQLQSLIALAIEHNRDLRVAVARVEEARAQYGLSGAERLPTLNFSGAVAATGTPASLSTTGAQVNSRRIDMSLSSASFELDFWGRLAGLSEAARYSYLASEESRRLVHLSLVTDVASAYFSFCQMSELASLARWTVELREKSLDLTIGGRDLGGAYELEVQQARAIFESSRANLDGLVHQRTVAANRLNFLTGYALMSLTRCNTTDLTEIAVIASDIPSGVLVMRPDVMAAEQRLRAAHANIGAARAAFLPRILLTASMGLASQGLSSLFSGAAWSFQPVMTLPFFDGGRSSSNLGIAEARKILAIAEYEKTIQQAFREVADLLSERRAIESQVRAATANTSSQEKRIEILRARYAAGLISLLDVLEGQRELIASQQSLIQARRQYLESAAQLFKAFGGGGGVNE